MKATVFAGILVGVIVIGAALAMQNIFSPAEPFPVPGRIHLYRDPAVSLNNIDLKVFYVVPAGAAPTLSADVRVVEFEESFRKIGHFHSVQFLGKSIMDHEVIPEPVRVGGVPASGTDLFGTDLAVLNAIATQAPLLHSPSSEHFTVSVFIFEGNGMGGAQGLAYVPAAIFREVSLRPVRESVIYRAIGHALGMPEGNDGVMGAGAFRPLEMNFVEPELTQKMGLLD